jgi:predicted RNase H-like HicB family nuclease
MKTVTIIYWQEDDGKWLGYLKKYPDYMTQPETLEELNENLEDIFKDVSGGFNPQGHNG